MIVEEAFLAILPIPRNKGWDCQPAVSARHLDPKAVDHLGETPSPRSANKHHVPICDLYQKECRNPNPDYLFDDTMDSSSSQEIVLVVKPRWYENTKSLRNSYL